MMPTYSPNVSDSQRISTETEDSPLWHKLCDSLKPTNPPTSDSHVLPICGSNILERYYTRIKDGSTPRTMLLQEISSGHCEGGSGNTVLALLAMSARNTTRHYILDTLH